MNAKRREKFGVCPLCGRACWLTFHHLIPLKIHRRVFFKKNYSREALHEGIDICRTCHDGIHDRYDEMTLGKRLATLEALRDDPALQKHFQWASKQKVPSMRTR